MTLIEAITKYNNDELARWPVGSTAAECFLETTDLNVWAGREVLTAAEFNDWVGIMQVYSDRYKDAHGSRPYSIPQTLSELREADKTITRINDRYFEEKVKARQEELRKERTAKAITKIRKRRSVEFGSMLFGDTLLSALEEASK